MENLILSFNVVAPLIVYMAIGALLRVSRAIGEDVMRGANNIIYYVALPVMCYRAVANSDLSNMLDTPFLLYIAIGIILVYVLTAIIVPLCSRDNRKRGVLILGVFRSNDAIFGLPVAAALLGDGNLGLMSVAISLSVPLFSLFSVISMEHYRGERVRFGKLLLRIVTNPVILGCLVGYVVNLLQVRLPSILQKSIDSIAAVTTPLAFLLLGGTITFSAFRKNRLAISVVSALRLLVIPVAMLAVFLLTGFRGEFIVIALIIFGAPIAMTTYTMAVGMQADDELAGALVASTSVLSILTMFLFIFLLKQLAWI